MKKQGSNEHKIRPYLPQVRKYILNASLAPSHSFIIISLKCLYITRAFTKFE